MMSIVDWNANSGPPGDLAIIFLRRVKERRRTKLWVHTLDTTSAGSIPICWASVSPLMGQVQRKGTSKNCPSPPPKKNVLYRDWREREKTEWEFDSKRIWGQTGTKLVCEMIISTLGL